MGIAFRQKALAKLKSPEELDEPVRVMWQLKRVAQYTLAATLFVALIWAIFGRLPSSGRGQGILMAPNTVVPIQSEADGQIGQWLVKVGDVVKKGDLLGILEQPVIERQLQEAQAKLADLQMQQKQLSTLRNVASKLQKQANQREGEQLRRRIEYLNGYIANSRKLANEINTINIQLLQIQKDNAVKARSEAEQLTKDLQQRVEAYQRLRDENIASEDTLRGTRMRYDNMLVRQKELDLQGQQLDLSRVQAAQTYLDAQEQIATNEHSVTELNLQLQGLDAREAQQDKVDSEAEIRDQNQADDLLRTIDRYQKQLQRAREIRSGYDGRVLELPSVEGSLVTFGQRLVQLDTRESGQDLIGIAFFQDSIGKYLTVGVPVRVVPLTVDQNRYGSIRGVIASVSDYPVTLEAAVNSIGNQDVASNLTKGGYQIEATVKLQRDSSSSSGFAWTSKKGPAVEITSGTTATVWVTYEQRAPISYILPKIREWSGLSFSTKSIP